MSLTLAEEALRHCEKGVTSPRHCDLLEYVHILTVAHLCSSLGRLQVIGDYWGHRMDLSDCSQDIAQTKPLPLPHCKYPT